ncbi:hypothetical protein ACEPAG_1902 [Sanghuangporus baumii]
MRKTVQLTHSAIQQTRAPGQRSHPELDGALIRPGNQLLEAIDLEDRSDRQAQHLRRCASLCFACLTHRPLVLKATCSPPVHCQLAALPGHGPAVLAGLTREPPADLASRDTPVAPLLVDDHLNHLLLGS